MSARAAVQSLLEGDGQLAGLGVQTVYAGNSVDTPEEECFLVVRWEDKTAAFGSTASGRCSIWAHDKSRDYGRINEVLIRLRTLLVGTVHRSGEDGWTLTLAEWLGEGPDLFDGGFGTVVRYADFTVVSRYDP